ncbi:MAG: LysM peptidoglycan-binding domain-containing protein [Muribaculaceae bacterium]|nr:LysM peptidoglycan-binding domain-containing protein [Muribaculaceae bacterium]
MKKYILALSAILATVGVFAQNNKGNVNVLDLKHSITDQAIVYPESFETDTQKLLESWFIKNYTSTDDRYATEGDVVFSDEVIIDRLKALPNVIEMPYNQIVRSYIDKYTKSNRAQVPALLGLGLYYNPIFEQSLEEQGLPLELKYLPMIESSLDPNAVSKHGAAGLWQFMLATAKGLGMEVNSLVDERRDPYLSSEMAASYLKGLYDTYGDWTLAIAAYNCGPGTLNKAIRRAGGEPKDHDFWSVYNYLPEETKGYVPAFIAINYVMNYYPEHNISPVLPTAPLVMDTIHVSDRIHFEQISQVLNIPVEELRILNPQYRADIIPGTSENPRNLILPSQQIHAYLMSEEDIKNYEPEKYLPRDKVEPGEIQGDSLAVVEDTEIWAEPITTVSDKVERNGETQTIVHKVKAGETLASIAKTYEVTQEDIKKTNNLRRNAVRVGQQLKITTSAPQAEMESTAAAVTKPAPSNNKTQTSTPKKQTTTSSKTTTHLVSKGETLSTIAKKYGTTITAIKNANGLKNDNIRAGQTLKIPAKSTGTTSSNKSSAGTKKKKR